MRSLIKLQLLDDILYRNRTRNITATNSVKTLAWQNYFINVIIFYNWNRNLFALFMQLMSCDFCKLNAIRAWISQIRTKCLLMGDISNSLFKTIHNIAEHMHLHIRISLLQNKQSKANAATPVLFVWSLGENNQLWAMFAYLTRMHMATVAEMDKMDNTSNKQF